MNTYRSKPLGAALGLAWRRFQYWRAMRMYAQVVRLKDRAERLFAKANRLIGRNVQAPMPLFDRDRDGR